MILNKGYPSSIQWLMAILPVPYLEDALGTPLLQKTSLNLFIQMVHCV